MDFASETTDAVLYIREGFFRTSIWTDRVPDLAEKLRPTSDVIVEFEDSPESWTTHVGGLEDDPAAEGGGANDPYGANLRIGIRVLDDGVPSLDAGEFTMLTLSASLLASFEVTAGFACGEGSFGPWKVEGAALNIRLDPFFLRDLTVTFRGLRSMTLLLPHFTTFQLGGDFDSGHVSLSDASYRAHVEYPGLEVYFRPLHGIPFIGDSIKIPLLELLSLSGDPVYGTTAQWLGSPHNFDLRRVDFDAPILLASDEEHNVGPQPFGCGIQMRPMPISMDRNHVRLPASPEALGGNDRYVITVSPPLPLPGDDTEVFFLPAGGTQILSMFMNHTGSNLVGC